MKHLIMTLLCTILFTSGTFIPHPLAFLTAGVTLVFMGAMFSWVSYRPGVMEMLAVPTDVLYYEHLMVMVQGGDMPIYVDTPQGIRPATGAFVARYQNTKALIIETFTPEAQ